MGSRPTNPQSITRLPDYPITRFTSVVHGPATICRLTGGAGWPAACVTFTDWPAMVTFVVRARGSADASTVNVAVPEPLLLAGLIEIHGTESVVVHEQPAVVVIVTVAVPPAPAIVTLVGVTV